MRQIMVLLCWECKKQYSRVLYSKWLKERKVYRCSCGGQVISNSGKVIAKQILTESKDDLNQELKHMDMLIEEIEQDIERKELELECDIKVLTNLKIERYGLHQEIDK